MMAGWKRWRRAGFPVLVGGMIFAALGTYFGNAWIAASQILLLAGMGMMAFETWRGRRSGPEERETGVPGSNVRRLPTSAWILLGLAVWCGVTIVVNAGRIESEIDHLKKLRYFLVALLFLAWPLFFQPVLVRPALRRAVVVAWMVSLVVATVAGLIAHFGGINPLLGEPPPIPGQASGLFGQVMTYGYSLQCSVLLLGAVVVAGDEAGVRFGLPRWVWIGVCLVAAAGLYFSFARGAMLGTIVGALVFTALYSRKLVAVLLVIGLVVGSVAYATNARYFNFLDGVSDETGVRLRQWETAALTFLDNPGVGAGYLNFERISAENKQRYGLPEDNVKGQVYFASHAHNNYLEMFASTGAVGGLGFLWFCGQWVREVGRSRRVRLFFLPVLVAFLVSGLFECTFTDSEVLHLLMLIYVASQLALVAERAGVRKPAVREL